MIGTFNEVAPKFPFVCFVTNDNWVKSNTAVAQGFAKAWLAAVAWLYDPANRKEAEKHPRRGAQADARDRRCDLRGIDRQEPGRLSARRQGRSDVLSGMIDVMIEGEELAARPQGDLRRFLDDTMLGGK